MFSATDKYYHRSLDFFVLFLIGWQVLKYVISQARFLYL